MQPVEKKPAAIRDSFQGVLNFNTLARPSDTNGLVGAKGKRHKRSLSRSIHSVDKSFGNGNNKRASE